LTTHIITFGCQLDKQQKICKNINVINLDEAKTLHFVGQMYKATTTPKSKWPSMKCMPTSTRPGSIPYSSSSNFLPNAKHTEMTAWQTAVLTVQCTSTTSQPIAALSSSDFTTRNLYIEGLEESLAAAQEYVAKKRAPTPDKLDPVEWNLTPNANSLASSWNKTPLS
jgi:hypothetical protein